MNAVFLIERQAKRHHVARHFRHFRHLQRPQSHVRRGKMTKLLVLDVSGCGLCDFPRPSRLKRMCCVNTLGNPLPLWTSLNDTTSKSVQMFRCTLFGRFRSLVPAHVGITRIEDLKRSTVLRDNLLTDYNHAIFRSIWEPKQDACPETPHGGHIPDHKIRVSMYATPYNLDSRPGSRFGQPCHRAKRSRRWMTK